MQITIQDLINHHQDEYTKARKKVSRDNADASNTECPNRAKYFFHLDAIDFLKSLPKAEK